MMEDFYVAKMLNNNGLIFGSKLWFLVPQKSNYGVNVPLVNYCHGKTSFINYKNLLSVNCIFLIQKICKIILPEHVFSLIMSKVGLFVMFKEQ